VVPRLPIRLDARGGWGATRLALPAGDWTDVFTDERVTSDGSGTDVGELLRAFPVALLVREGSA